MTFTTIIENVPTELANYPQWVSWSGTLGKNGKIKKIPISPRTGRFAQTNSSGTWGAFEEAVDFSWEHNLPGVGFALTENDDFVGINFATALTLPLARLTLMYLQSLTAWTPTPESVHPAVVSM